MIEFCVIAIGVIVLVLIGGAKLYDAWFDMMVKRTARSRRKRFNG